MYIKKKKRNRRQKVIYFSCNSFSFLHLWQNQCKQKYSYSLHTTYIRRIIVQNKMDIYHVTEHLFKNVIK
ncbi:hypothetical protein NQ318_002595 [Aromia moschata]|uniref:Ribosomal protein L20 n=1 Tax=Aromia moschata TaxID=1265417 RepID=A0AAV8XW66_9CUCU|nr:hypothetical protein NQ318_002595 [Aromia moschata]